MSLRTTAVVISIAVFSAQPIRAAEILCKLGEDRWIRACEASCTANWKQPSCEASCVALAPPGWLIVERRVSPVSINDGHYRANDLSSAQNFDYAARIGDAYDQVAAVARRRQFNEALFERIKADRSSALQEAESTTSLSQIRLTVLARSRGHVLNQVRGWSTVALDIRVRCVAPSNIRTQLLQRYQISPERTWRLRPSENRSYVIFAEGDLTDERTRSFVQNPLQCTAKAYRICHEAGRDSVVAYGPGTPFTDILAPGECKILRERRCYLILATKGSSEVSGYFEDVPGK